MEQKKRTKIKAQTWQSMGFIVKTLLGYLNTGYLRSAGGLAVATFVTGTIMFIIHERVWEKINWGRIEPAAK
jgi:uncharacterized membrane protein